MFTATTIKEIFRESPYVPKRIVTSSGQAYDIPHPDLIWVGKHFIFAGTASTDTPDIFESASRISILHVADIQDLPRSAPALMNGAAH